MADYGNDLAIILRYDGTATKFNSISDKSPYYGKVVFCAGDTNGTDQAIWVSEEGSSDGKFLNLSDVKGVKVNSDSSIYKGTINLVNGTGVTVSVNTANQFVFSLNSEYQAKINDTATKATNNAAAIKTLQGDVGDIEEQIETLATKTELQALVSDGTDDASDDTIKGAKKYADSVGVGLLGTDEDTINSETIRGNKNAIQAVSDAYPVVISSSDMGYTVSQGGVPIGTISIPKDLVVTSGSVVYGKWENGKFSENQSGTGTGTDAAIKLVIANQAAPVYVNVKDLVDIYTGATGATEVQVTVNGYTISARLVNDSVTTSKIKDSNVTTAKIADNAVTEAKISSNAVTTAKIKDANVTKAKLSGGLQASIDKADSSVQSIGSSATQYIKISGSASSPTIEPMTKTMDSTNASDGLATTDDIKAYLAKRLSVRVIQSN